MHIEKEFSGTHEGRPFTVVWRVDYNTFEDRLAFTASINASAIPANTPIIFSYAVDTYVNANDYARAITSPDLSDASTPSYNNSNTTKTLTPAQVRSLNFVGCINQTTNGTDMFGFYADGGRKFDRAYSALCDHVTSPQQYLQKSNQNNDFDYGTKTDNGIGIAYENIPAGRISVIHTSMFLAANVTSRANLDWTWNDSKILTIAVGTPLNLKVNATNLGTTQINNVAYTVAMPSGLSIGSAVTHSGFTGGTYTGSAGNTSCSVSGATLNVNTTGTLTIPVSTEKYGHWTLAAAQFSGLTNTVSPAGITPANLTVTSEVNYSSAAGATAIREGAANYTIKLPDGIVANGDLTVNLTNSNTTDFTAPASVVIPDGDNSATFSVTAKATATPGATNTTTISSLSGPNSAYVNIGAINAVTTTAKVPVLTQPADQTVCSGAAITVNFTGTDIVTANCSWTNNNAAIGLGASGNGDISFTATNTTNNPISGTITVTPNGKGDSKKFTITVNPTLTPSVVISANPGFEVCEDSVSSITFTATPTNGGSSPSYEWKIDDVKVSGVSTGSYTLNNLNLYRKSKVTCILTSSLQCTTTPTATDEKKIRISSCVISANPHMRGTIIK
jgi:hypothetical protein